MIKLVEVSLGLWKEANSFENIEVDLGQLCFCESIESSMQQTSAVPTVVAESRDLARAAQ